MTVLKEKMKSKNLSIAVLERKTGVAIHSIRNVLKEKVKNPRAEILSAIEEVLECSLLDLINSSSSSSNFWQGNNIMNKKNKYLEHPIFMAACANVVAILLEEKALTLSFEDYFAIIRRLYFYSLPKEPRIPDIKFAKWLLEEEYILQTQRDTM